MNCNKCGKRLDEKGFCECCGIYQESMPTRILTDEEMKIIYNKGKPLKYDFKKEVEE